jgi:hypothetical protein
MCGKFFERKLGGDQILCLRCIYSLLSFGVIFEQKFIKIYSGVIPDEGMQTRRWKLFLGFMVIFSERIFMNCC